ncbi:Os02g0692901 [Oryza sativa Japonica Group]|uniref:Os02g0692901 protein n=1 Tax=Oryza sativa subsp. japonica TaxID=39947 RepID=A0A0P0VNB3_ORYSJ|nr:Os02g0692901 [Oryza sativa Japonica Group]
MGSRPAGDSTSRSPSPSRGYLTPTGRGRDAWTLRRLGGFEYSAVAMCRAVHRAPTLVEDYRGDRAYAAALYNSR